MPRDATTVKCLDALRTSLDNLPDALFEASTTPEASPENDTVAGHIIQLRKMSYTVKKNDKDEYSCLHFRITITYPSPTPVLNLNLYVFHPDRGVVRTRAAVRRGIDKFKAEGDTFRTHDQTA